MENIRFKLSDSAISWLASHNVNPFLYDQLDEKPGLQLRNMGPDVKVLSRTKSIAFEQGVAQVDTGITLDLPDGILGIIVAEKELSDSPLIDKSPFFWGSNSHCCVSLINYGERDIVIKRGGLLPVRLIFSTQFHVAQVSRESEYANHVQNKVNDLIQKRNQQ